MNMDVPACLTEYKRKMWMSGTHRPFHYFVESHLKWSCGMKQTLGVVGNMVLLYRHKHKYDNTGLFKKKYTLSKFFSQKLLKLNSCPVCGWKGNLSKFWYRLYEAAHHWGCGCCYLWHAATSVGRARLSISHLPRYTWGSHRVLVRCENNFDSSPFSLYI
jgi:hypothetical protein